MQTMNNSNVEVIILATSVYEFAPVYREGFVYVPSSKTFVSFQDQRRNYFRHGLPVRWTLQEWTDFVKRVNFPPALDGRTFKEYTARMLWNSTFINVRWFSPFLDRLLAGEHVPIEEMNEAHRAVFDGKPLRYFENIELKEYSPGEFEVYPSALCQQILEEETGPLFADPPAQQYALIPFGEPQNELEKALVSKYEKRIDINDFLNILINSEVSVLTKIDQLEVVDGQTRMKDMVELYTVELRNQSHLAVFTSSPRTSQVSFSNHGFDCEMKMKFRELFPMMPSGKFGLILNPSYEKNMSWDATQIADIIASSRPKS